MGIKKYTAILFIAAFAFLNIQFQCKKFGCVENTYGFELGIKAYPDKDSIKVGDTIWLEINESTTLKDSRSGAMIDYSGAANLGSVISFHQLSTLNQFTIKAIDKFGLILYKGTQVSSLDPAFERQYIFGEENQNYLFKLGIIAKEIGTFGIIVSNAANVFRKNDNCTKAFFALNFKNTNQHYNLNPNFQGGPTPIGGDYYFVVK